MKKMLALLLAFFVVQYGLIFGQIFGGGQFPSGAIAETGVDGTFVPNYDSFMESFCDNLSTVDSSFLTAFKRYYDGKHWEDVSTSLSDQFVTLDAESELAILAWEEWGQLLSFSIRIPQSASEANVDLFREIAKCACIALYPETEQRWSSIIRGAGLNYSANRHDSKKEWHQGVHAYCTEWKDGYIYFYIEFLNDDSKTIHKTPYGFEY